MVECAGSHGMVDTYMGNWVWLYSNYSELLCKSMSI